MKDKKHIQSFNEHQENLNIENTHLLGVYIDIGYKEDLIKAKEVLLNRNQIIDNIRFEFLEINSFENHLMLGTEGWFVGNTKYRTEITLEELDLFLSVTNVNINPK